MLKRRGERDPEREKRCRKKKMKSVKKIKNVKVKMLLRFMPVKLNFYKYIVFNQK